MKYLSAREIAEKWGLSLRSVQYFCANGRIPGAQNLGKQWVIPADAVRPSDTRRGPVQSVTETYMFPLFIFSPAFTYSESLSLCEQTLFEAQMKFLEGENTECIRICREVLDFDIPLHVRMGAYYFIATGAMLLGNHYEYRKTLEIMTSSVDLSDPHFEDYKLIMQSVKRGIGWDHSILYDIDAEKLSPAALYYYQYESLMSVVLGVENVTRSALNVYDALARQVSAEGIEPLEVHMHLLLASLHIRAADKSAEEHTVCACRIAFSRGWPSLVAKNLSLADTLVRKVLDRDAPGWYRIVDEMHTNDINNWRIVNSIESGTCPCSTFSPEYFAILFLICQGLSNSQICTVMDLSPAELRNLLRNCYEIAGVSNRRELKKYTVSQYSTWFRQS